jgi:hypothetical protein
MDAPSASHCLICLVFGLQYRCPALAVACQVGSHDSIPTLYPGRALVRIIAGNSPCVFFSGRDAISGCQRACIAREPVTDNHVPRPVHESQESCMYATCEESLHAAHGCSLFWAPAWFFMTRGSQCRGLGRLRTHIRRRTQLMDMNKQPTGTTCSSGPRSAGLFTPPNCTPRVRRAA